MISNSYETGLQKKDIKKKFDDARAKGEAPIAPSIPEELIKKMTERYVIAYERFTSS